MDEKSAAILAEYRAGARVVDLAKKIGRSPKRVYQLIDKGIRAEQRKLLPLGGLSTRTMNCLRAEGITSREEVRAAMQDGRLADVPNLGVVSLVEIERWLAAGSEERPKGSADIADEER